MTLEKLESLRATQLTLRGSDILSFGIVSVAVKGNGARWSSWTVADDVGSPGKPRRRLGG